MSEEEIKALAAELGLDSERLRLFEPWQFEDMGRFYRFRYHAGGKVIDYSFCLSGDDPEAIGVKFYVNKGLRELAEKVNGPHV
jgi:hypothetical protein